MSKTMIRLLKIPRFLGYKVLEYYRVFINFSKRTLGPYKFRLTPLSWLSSFNASAKPLNNKAVLDLVTISFNNAEVIKHQIKLLRQNLKDKFHYTVVDNSNHPAAMEQIASVCRVAKVAYIKLPTNPSANPSISHGYALNWAYWHYIRKRQAKYFGFIDHDIFPIKPTSVVKQLKKLPVFGLVQERAGVWYFWGGFNFYTRSFVKHSRLNFIPPKHLDTGGANYARVFSRVDRSQLPDLNQHYQKIGKGNDPQADLVERIGDWLHTINGSNWANKKDKNSLVAKLLSNYLS
jgi:hypothetical protein